MSSFTCTACTYVNTNPNAIQTQRCEICATFQTGQAAANHAAKLAESAAQAAMDAARAAATSQGGCWPCPACSYINSMTKHKCDMCHSRRTDDRGTTVAAGGDAEDTMTSPSASSGRRGRSLSRQSSRSASSAAFPSPSTPFPLASSSPPVSVSSSVSMDDGIAASSSASPPVPLPVPASRSSSSRRTSRSKRRRSRARREMDVDMDGDGGADAAMAVAAIATPPRKGHKSGLHLSPGSALAATFEQSMAPFSTSASFVRSLSYGLLGGGQGSSSAASFANATFTIPTAAAPTSSSSNNIASSTSSSSSSSAAAGALHQFTNEDARPELTDAEAETYFRQFLTVARMVQDTDREERKEDKITVKGVLDELYEQLQYSPRHTSFSSSSSSAAASLTSTQCEVCYSDFDGGEDGCIAVRLSNCGHARQCRDCLHQYASIKIKDGAVVPWITCPVPNCPHPLTVHDLIHGCSLNTLQLASLAASYMRKRLVRCEAFVSCTNENIANSRSNSAHASSLRQSCLAGFVIPLTKAGRIPKARTMRCPLCNMSQKVERGKEGELDEEFKLMTKQGTLRPCPKCKHLTMKEKGVCNVIQCIKCHICWNWRTRETGKDTHTLKQKARMNGTLWEHGELEYQRHLERTDLAAFKALLERNGQKYDPNYMRGSG